MSIDKNDTFHIENISSDLYTDKNGIWISRGTEKVSYPSEGNSLCFELEEGSFWFEHRNNIISDMVRKYGTTKYEKRLDVLDIGGGNGFVSARLVRDGHNVVLVEPGHAGALNAKKIKELPNVICSTLKDAKLKSESLYAAGAFDVLEHIEDDRSYVKEVARVIKPGGLFVVTVPAHMYLWSNEDENAGHFRRYTKESLIEVMDPWFESSYISYFFKPLVLPVFLLRSIPSRLCMTNKRNVLSNRAEHGTRRGLLTKLIKMRLESERKKIQQGKQVHNGSSICFAGYNRRYK